jgi:hypothetical protein
VRFPSAIEAAIDLKLEDEVQWGLLDRGELHLVRLQPTEPQAQERSTTKATKKS